jgi:hypothetical protein
MDVRQPQAGGAHSGEKRSGAGESRLGFGRRYAIDMQSPFSRSIATEAGRTHQTFKPGLIRQDLWTEAARPAGHPECDSERNGIIAQDGVCIGDFTETLTISIGEETISAQIG